MLYQSRAPIYKCCLCHVDSHGPLRYFGSVPICPVTETVPHLSYLHVVLFLMCLKTAPTLVLAANSETPSEKTSFRYQSSWNEDESPHLSEILAQRQVTFCDKIVLDGWHGVYVGSLNATC